MAEVRLSILEPVHGTAVPAASAVTLRGRVDDDPTSGGLHYRWWSSLPTDPPRPAPQPPPDLDLDEVAVGTSLQVTQRLSPGSHTVTLSAKDVAGDDETALAAVRFAGTTGGAPGTGDAPCVLHVVAATLLLPAGRLVSRSAGVAATAPASWADEAYQAVNGLAYRWRFRPEPADGRPEVVVNPSPADLDFHEQSEQALPFLPPPPVPPRVVAGLPATLSTDGRGYRLTLTVSAAGLEQSAEQLVQVVP